MEQHSTVSMSPWLPCPVSLSSINTTQFFHKLLVWFDFPFSSVIPSIKPSVLLKPSSHCHSSEIITPHCYLKIVCASFFSQNNKNNCTLISFEDISWALDPFLLLLDKCFCLSLHWPSLTFRHVRQILEVSPTHSSPLDTTVFLSLLLQYFRYIDSIYFSFLLLYNLPPF